MNRVIIICHDPLIVQTERNFMIPQLIERGYEVEYWDVSRYVAGGLPIAGELKRDYLCEITVKREFEHALERVDVDRSVFIVEVRECWENRELFRTLGQRGCYIFGVNMYANVIPLSLSDRLITFMRHPIRTVWLRVANYLYGRYKRRWGYTTYRDCFSSSATDRATTRLINHPDYDKWRALMSGREARENHIVFIDNFFPEHPDIQHRHNYRDLNGDRYRASLMRYFSMLEQRYGLPVKIAAHPKAHYTSESFGGREIVQYRTEELVVDAAAVILHTSNAISFALLSRKPIEIVTNSEYNKCHHLRLMMERIAGELGCKICDIDQVKSIDECVIEPVAESVRERYIYSYLTDSTTESRTNIEILTEYINSVKR